MDYAKVNRVLKALRTFAADPKDRPTMTQSPSEQFAVLANGDSETVAAALWAIHPTPDENAFPIFGFPLSVGEAEGMAQTLEVAAHMAVLTKEILRSTVHTAILAFRDRVVFGVVSEQLPDTTVSVVYAVLYREGESIQVAYAGQSYEYAKEQFATFTADKN